MIFMKEKVFSFLKNLNDIDPSISKIMYYGFIISLLIGIASIATLLFYNYSYISYDLVEASVMLFQMGLLFTVQIFACGCTIDFIKKFNS